MTFDHFIAGGIGFALACLFLWLVDLWFSRSPVLTDQTPNLEHKPLSIEDRARLCEF